MIADLKPYAEYKESSQRWLGEVPKHWSVLPNRALFAELKDRDHPDEEMLSVTITRVIVRQKALLDDAGGRKAEPELDRLSNILKTFNEQFGTLFTDTDRVAKRIRDDIAPQVAADPAYQNAKQNTPHTARMAHDQALGRVMQHLLKDDTQVYKQFVENESFKRFVGDMVYAITNQ